MTPPIPYLFSHHNKSTRTSQERPFRTLNPSPTRPKESLRKYSIEKPSLPSLIPLSPLPSRTQTRHDRRQRPRQPNPNPTPQRNFLIQCEPPSRPRPRPRRRGRRTSSRRPLHRRATRRNRHLHRTRHEPARRRRYRRRHRTPIAIAGSDELGFGHGERGPGGSAVGEEDVGGGGETRGVAAEPDAVREDV